MKPYTRADRISGKIQFAITELLSKKMQDPRIEMATVSSVKLTSDLRVANVYIAVFGDKKRILDVMDGFNNSKGFIKKSIAPKLGLKFMPDLKLSMMIRLTRLLKWTHSLNPLQREHQTGKTSK